MSSSHYAWCPLYFVKCSYFTSYRIGHNYFPRLKRRLFILNNHLLHLGSSHPCVSLSEWMCFIFLFVCLPISLPAYQFLCIFVGLTFCCRFIDSLFCPCYCVWKFGDSQTQVKNPRWNLIPNVPNILRRIGRYLWIELSVEGVLWQRDHLQ